MGEHTPGPWLAAPYSSIVGRGVFAPSAQGRVICQVTAGSESDANLIAAAPELLEALEVAVWDYNGPLEDAPHWVVNAQEAIARARGESNG